MKDLLKELKEMQSTKSREAMDAWDKGWDACIYEVLVTVVSYKTKMIDKESLKMLDESLIRDHRLWDSAHIDGWDHAFDVIENYMAKEK